MDPCCFIIPPTLLNLLLQTYQWIEFFAGRARATLSMKAAGYRCARLDVAYFPKQVDMGMNTNYFDILSPSGFAYKA